MGCVWPRKNMGPLEQNLALLYHQLGGKGHEDPARSVITRELKGHCRRNMPVPISRVILPQRLWLALGKAVLYEASCFTGDIMAMKVFSVPPPELSSKCGRRDCRHCMGVFWEEAISEAKSGSHTAGSRAEDTDGGETT